MVASLLIEDDVQTLKQLGLSENQGKVLLALSRSGISSAKEISKTSGVTREKVYTVLLSLQEKGLVRRTLSVPTAFEAIPLGESISSLLKQKLKDYKDLRTKTAKLIHNHMSNFPNTSCPDQDSALVLVPQNKAVLSYIQKCIENTETSMDVVTTWEWYTKLTLFSDSLSKAQKKNVRFRMIVQKPEKYDFLRHFVRLMGINHCQYKTISFSPPAITCVYDRKQVIFYTKTGTGLEESPVIFSKNSSFVELANSYFEKMWNNGTLYNE